jgi:dolichyl-phosphate-mannose-protein mannosyltransferase
MLEENLELTACLSVKMIGLFVTALVGLYTIEDLWEKFGDLKMPVVSLALQVCPILEYQPRHPA